MIGEENCPQCGALVAVNEGFVTWCSECAWNLAPISPELAADPILVAVVRRAHEETDRLFRDISANRAVLFDSSTVRRSRLICNLIGRFPRLVVLMALLTSLLAVIRPRSITKDELIEFGLKAFLLLFAIKQFIELKRRRSHRASTSEVIGAALNRDQLPATFGLIDEICHQLVVRPPTTVSLTPWLNAMASPTQLHIGIPLVVALEADEFLVLLGHELAHNRKNERGLTAIVRGTDRMFARLLKAGPTPRPRSVLSRWRATPQTALTRAWGVLMAHRLRIHQVVEYRADTYAASIGGAAAAIRLLTILPRGQSVEIGARRAIANGDDVWSGIRERIRSVPAAEVTRLRRLSVYRPRPPDFSHPPLEYRIVTLENGPVDKPRVELTEARFAKIANEVMTHGKEIENAINVAAGQTR
jgi:Zn-dependent protease with chaperone function